VASRTRSASSCRCCSSALAENSEPTWGGGGGGRQAMDRALDGRAGAGTEVSRRDPLHPYFLGKDVPHPPHPHLQRRERVAVLDARARLPDPLLHVLVPLRHRHRVLHRLPQPREKVGVHRGPGSSPAGGEARGQLFFGDEAKAEEEGLERARGRQVRHHRRERVGGGVPHPKVQVEAPGGKAAAGLLDVCVEGLRFGNGVGGLGVWEVEASRGWATCWWSNSDNSNSDNSMHACRVLPAPRKAQLRHAALDRPMRGPKQSERAPPAP